VSETYLSGYAARRRFVEEGWLLPIEIARACRWKTDKPVKAAIRSGALKAQVMFGRLVVAESELERYRAEQEFVPVATREASKARRESDRRPRRSQPSARRGGLSYSPKQHRDFLDQG
jgi:hypothetical protein